MLHHGLCLVLMMVLLLTSPSHASLYRDTVILRDIFAALQGPTMWPPIWKEHWTTDTIDPNGVTTCTEFRDWHGATCSGAKRIVKLSHRSGLATGEFPDTVTGLTELQYFDWSENNIKGRVPSFRGGTSPGLFGIALSGNRLTGPIPDSLGELKALRFLALSRNALNGTIPDSIGGCVALEALLLDGNHLTGPFPESLYSLRNLRHLRLDRNQLTGKIDGGRLMDAMPNLLVLELAGNPKLELVWDARLSNLHLVSLPTDTPGGDQTSGRSSGWKSSVTINGKSVYVPRGDVKAPARFMVMGDFGTGGQMMGASRELASATHFVATAKWVDAQYTVTVGDNLYVVPWIPQEVFFQESYERLYGDAPLDRLWYPAIGNHDSRSQFSYADRNIKWQMKYGEYVAQDPSTPHRVCSGDAAPRNLVDVFIHDTLRSGAYAFKGRHWQMLTGALKNSTAVFKLVVGHYPPLSSGCHKPVRGGAAVTVALQAAGGNVVFSGHDHHSEALYDKSQNVFHFLVGAYARGPCVISVRGDSTFIEKALGGFTYATADALLMNVTFISEIGHVQAKVTVPHNWRDRKMNATPSQDDIAEYIREGETRQRRCKLDKKDTRDNSPPPPPPPAPPANDKRASRPTLKPAVEQPSDSVAPLPTQGVEQSVAGPAVATPPMTAVGGDVQSVQRGASHRPRSIFTLSGPPSDGSDAALWWATAVVCAAVPVLILLAMWTGSNEEHPLRRRAADVEEDNDHLRHHEEDSRPDDFA